MARLSDDTIHIEFRDEVHAGEPEAPAAIIDDVKAGKFDLGWTSSADRHQMGDELRRRSLAPFLMDSYDLEEKVLASDMASRCSAGLDASASWVSVSSRAR